MNPARMAVLARVAPFATYLALLVIESAVSAWMPEWDTRWFYPLKTLLVGGMLAAFWRQYSELHEFRFCLYYLVLSVAFGLSVFALWVGIDAPWAMLSGESKGYDPRVDGQIDWVLAGIRLAGAALVVPLMEELFWRSLVMRWIDQENFLARHPAAISLRAVLISSVVFGFEHQLWLAGILAGLAYAWLYRYTRHLSYAIIAHGVTNGMLGAWVLATGQWRYW